MRHLDLLLDEGVCNLHLAGGVVLEDALVEEAVNLVGDRVSLLNLRLHLGQLRLELPDGLKLRRQRRLMIRSVLLVFLNLRL